MSFLAWLYSKSLAGIIAKDIVRQYNLVIQKYSKASNEEILGEVWELWLSINEPLIREDDSENKIIRLDITKEKYKKEEHASLLQIYSDVLFIETETNISDGKLYDRALRIFIKEAEKYGLDFKNEYEFLRTIMY